MFRVLWPFSKDLVSCPVTPSSIKRTPTSADNLHVRGLRVMRTSEGNRDRENHQQRGVHYWPMSIMWGQFVDIDRDSVMQKPHINMLTKRDAQLLNPNVRIGGGRMDPVKEYEEDVHGTRSIPMIHSDSDRFPFVRTIAKLWYFHAERFSGRQGKLICCMGVLTLMGVMKIMYGV